MKIEFDSVEEICAIGICVCVALLIWTLAGCERVIDGRLKERLEQDHTHTTHTTP